MKVLITGMDGFVGAYMAKLCLEKGAEVYGTTYKATTEGIDAIKGKVTLIECDIRDSKAVAGLVKDVKADWIIHLAAQTFVPSAWENPALTYNINIIGSLNLFEAVKNSENYDPKILVACAANEYGHIKKDEVPITEKTPFNPDNPYAVSKVAVDMMAYQYFLSKKMKTIRVRPFNIVGPEQSILFVASDFAKQIADIEAGKKEPVIMVGNLEAKRDFSDVRDAVKAYWLLLEKGVAGEVYNVCSGNGMSIQQLLDMLLKLSTVKIEVRQDPKKMRPSDVPIIVGSYEKLKKLGWKPEIRLEETLKDILDYWRNKTR